MENKKTKHRERTQGKAHNEVVPLKSIVNEDDLIKVDGLEITLDPSEHLLLKGSGLAIFD